MIIRTYRLGRLIVAVLSDGRHVVVNRLAH